MKVSRFLVCCSDSNKGKLFNKIHSMEFFCNQKPCSFDFLEVMQLSVLEDNVLKLEKTIDAYNYVVLVSPSCIEFVKQAVSVAKFPMFMVMGRDSYDSLSKLTQQKIFYPQNTTGVSGLINEVIEGLELLDQKILILNGGGLNNKLVEEKLRIAGGIVDTLNVYQVSMSELSDEILKNVADHLRYQGIIVTSSSIVTWLFDMAGVHGVSLTSTKFITWHNGICARLKKFGAHNIQLIDTLKKVKR